MLQPSFCRAIALIKSHEQDKELATAVFTSLINPAYEQLKQKDTRADTLAMLRLEANGLQLLESSPLQSPISEELMEMSALSADRNRVV